MRIRTPFLCPLQCACVCLSLLAFLEVLAQYPARISSYHISFVKISCWVALRFIVCPVLPFEFGHIFYVRFGARLGT